MGNTVCTCSGDWDVGMTGGAILMLPITEHIRVKSALTLGGVEKDQHGSPEKESLG